MGKGLKDKILFLISGSLVKNTLKLTSGSIINYIIPFVTTPILTRLYTPDSYGDWGVFSSIISILSVFVCGGYENAIVEEQDKKKRNNISRVCLYVSFFVNLILLTLIIILSALKINILNIQNIIFLLPLYLFLTGIVSILQNYANANSQYGNLAFAQIVAGLTLGGFRILFGMLNVDNGLVYGAIISLVCVAAYMMYKDSSILLNQISLKKKQVRSIIIQYKNYPLYDAPSSFTIFLSNNIPVLLLVNFFDKALLGGYTMVLQLLLLPMSFIGSNMGRVFFQQASRDKNSTKTISKQVYKISYSLGLAVIVFFVIGGDVFLYWFLGPNWKMAGEYGLYLSLWAFFTIMYAPLKPIYRVLSKQSVQMKLMVISFIVQTGYLLLGVFVINDMGLIILSYSVVCSLFKIIEGKILLRLCQSNNLFYEVKMVALTILILMVWATRSLYVIGII